MLEVALALAEAHALGIVHRDLKPSNLFLTTRPDGTELVKVLDFGIAKADALAGTLTDTASLLGSPKYMSPEQIREARSVDARSDVWSLGVVLYELVTGRLPFEAYTATGVLSRIVTDEPTPMGEVFAGVTPGLEAVVMKMLAKAPNDRLGSVAAVASALAPFGDDAAPAMAERVAKVLGTPRVWSGAPDAHGGETEEPLPSTLPEPAAVGADETVTAASRTHGDALPAPSPRRAASRPRGWLPFAVGGALAAAVAVAFALRPGGEERGASTSASGVATATASVAVTAASSAAPTAVVPLATAPSAAVSQAAAPLALASAPPSIPRGAPTASHRVVAAAASSSVASAPSGFPDELDFGPRK